MFLRFSVLFYGFWLFCITGKLLKLYMKPNYLHIAIQYPSYSSFTSLENISESPIKVYCFWHFFLIFCSKVTFKEVKLYSQSNTRSIFGTRFRKAHQVYFESFVYKYNRSTFKTFKVKLHIKCHYFLRKSRI